MASDITKQHRRKFIFWKIIDIIMLISPLAYAFIKALVSNEVTTVGKASLVGSVMIALVLVMINFIAKLKLRCPLWIILIGIQIALSNILGTIIWLAVVTIIDELILQPIIAYERKRTEINATIDEREAEG